MAEFTGNDLTGTSWRFLRENAPNRDLNMPTAFRLEIASCSSVFSFGSYKIENYNKNYSYGGVVSNGYVWFGGQYSNTYGYFRVGTNLSFAPLAAPTDDYGTTGSAIEFTVTIGGGADVANEQVVSWFKRNGEYLVEGYSVTYHANGGTPEPENLTGQTNLPSPLPTIAKDGHVFEGWYLDSTFQTPAVAGATISTDTDLYAKFTSAVRVDVSNKTYHIKDDPYFAEGERIVGDFTSADHQFHEISIDIYEGDLEIWYIDRTDPDGSVLAYANGTWEIEYRYITFGENVSLSESDYRTLTWAYDEYIEPKILRITYQGVTKLGKQNGQLRGTIAYEGGVYPFDNRITWQTPVASLSEPVASTPMVEGVTKYKVYSNGTYIGYVDSNNVWHEEVSV